MTKKITHTVANSVEFNGPKRSVQFYKSTRPQAPARHKEALDLVALVECSVCRGLFFVDTPDVKKAHRAWHESTKVGDLYRPMACREITNASGRAYQFTQTCNLCGEDLCPCRDCQTQHGKECAQWQQVNALLDAGKDWEADAVADAILDAREVCYG